MTTIEANVRKVIEEAINEIQILSGESTVTFSDKICPIGGINNFDSLNSLEATVTICSKLKIKWEDVSLMICPKENKALNISEITQRVTKLMPQTNEQ